MDIGFIGLGNMGQPMARRLIEAGHRLVVYDTRNDAVAPLVALGAQVASSPQDVADQVETVMASLPSLQISMKVATGEGGVIHGKRVKRFVDLSTTGKFPSTILTRTFDYGFATALMLKDVRLCAEEARTLDVPNHVMSAVLDQWELTNTEFGGDSDFTSIVKMIERRAGVIVGKKP